MEKKKLIIRPRYGLCNQLLAISKGIIFGIICDRDIIFSGFQIDYRDENNLYDFNSIIDIDYLQKLINNQNINIQISSNLDINGTKINVDNEEKISNIKNFLKILLNKENEKYDFLDIENPISSTIPEEYDKLFRYINNNIKFTEKYIQIAENIKNAFNLLPHYVCIHLRLEDDAIKFMTEQNKELDIETINSICKTKYLDELEKIKLYDANIYICTSLEIEDNFNNNFYNELKEKYKIYDKNCFITKEDNKNYRELYGIIDYIIAKDSEYFIGSDWSSFSIYIYDSHLNNSKNAKLIDIYNSIKIENKLLF